MHAKTSSATSPSSSSLRLQYLALHEQSMFWGLGVGREWAGSGQGEREGDSEQEDNLDIGNLQVKQKYVD